ncbi:hypothetical protein [Streptomyces sp. NPDC051993]|uniref:hypothetical protein n=1 Tax=Streptomyces sp. NPDC051993 TaxID=3155286 RepID=UPI0034491CA4
MPLRLRRLKARLASPRMWLGAGAALVLAAANAPAVLGFATQQYHAYEIETDGYKAARGHWDVVAMPAAYQLNSIHAVLLRTGKVLLIAGGTARYEVLEGNVKRADGPHT